MASKVRAYVSIHGDWDSYFGGVHAVLYDCDKGLLYGGADPRRDGRCGLLSKSMQ